MAFTPKQEEFKSEAGNKYTFQTVLPSKWAQIIDRISDKHGKLLNSKAMPEMLEHVVVVPNGLKMDDFDTWSELEEVAGAAMRFQSGKKQ